MRNEAFLPSRHGFPCVLPPPEREDFGLGTPAPGAFGLSAGTAWVALDRFLAGRPLPELEPDTSRDEVLRMLVRRQKDALTRAGWLQLRDWQALPDRGIPGRKGLAERSRVEFRRLRQSLDDGTPVMLYLVLAQGRHADPSQNVAVLAYDYELDRRARRASVRVYDPSRPANDNVRLVFHAGADKAFDGRLAVQTPVRGFFCVPYDRPEPAALTLHGVGNEDARIETLLAVQGSAADASFEALGLGREGQLLHVRRRRSGGYAAEQVDVDVLDGCDVRQAAFVGSGRTVLWTSKGELIDCRRRPGLGWRARRITDTRTHGTFDGTATGVARERGRVSLFGCGTGRLMHFHRGRLPAWEAEHVDAGPLARAACVGTPAGARIGSAMHVVSRTRTGELMHARWRARGGWTAENITARAGNRERFLVVEDQRRQRRPSPQRVTAADPCGGFHRIAELTQPLHVAADAVGENEQPIHRPQRVAAERAVAGPPLVRERVVDDGQPPRRSQPPRHSPERGREERHPVLEDDGVRREAAEVPRRALPRERVHRVQQTRRVEGVGGARGLELRPAGEEELGVLPVERDGADAVAAHLQPPPERVGEVRDPAPVRIERADESEAKRAKHERRVRERRR